MTLSGLLTAREPAGMSLTTMLLALMVQPSPIVTLGRMVTWSPIQQSFPMVTGLAYSSRVNLSCGSVL